jgi:hypothetical protein
VTVRFDEKKLSYERLLGHAKEHGCTTKVWAATDAHLAAARKVVGDRATLLGKTSIRTAKESDQVYYLRNSPLRFLPITPLQARRVNGAMYLRNDIKPWLSPRQLELLAKVQALLAKKPNALDGLERPTDLAELDEYEAKLRSRLAD